MRKNHSSTFFMVFLFRYIWYEFDNYLFNQWIDNSIYPRTFRKILQSHIDMNNNNNNTNKDGTNEFISFYLQSLATRGERYKS